MTDAAVVHKQRESRGTQMEWLVSAAAPICESCEQPLYAHANTYLDGMLLTLLQADAALRASDLHVPVVELPTWCGARAFSECAGALIAERPPDYRAHVDLFRRKAELVSAVNDYLDDITDPRAKAYMTCRAVKAADAAVEAVLARIEGPIVLGLPLGIGKPNPFVNRLYQAVKADPTRHLTILTALSLEVPSGKSELEQHFLAPLVERVFKDYPDLEYVKDLRGPGLPPNIEVREFFFKTGDYLQNGLAQQQYISTNYTFVARDMLGQGLNVIAQAVAEREQDGERQISLSSNPDVVQEVVERYAEAGKPLLCIGVVNRQMPFMLGGALVPPSFFDILCDDPAATHTLFAPPNAKVSTADYAIGLHASSLVVDGGTLQIGIGSLGDAIGHALILRDRQGADYRRILESLCPDGLQGRELAPFQQGLYGCSEMFVNAFLALMDAGIIRREVYADATLQTLVNEGRLDPAQLPANVLELLAEEGCINLPPTAKDQAWLRRFGILDAEGRPGQRLRGGVCMTGGFFIGPGAFYEALRRLPEPERARIDMTRIDFINQLYGKSAEETQLKREQRRKARFMNTTMKVTLLGAAPATRWRAARWSAAWAGSTTSWPWRTRCPTRAPS
jgi:acyl-CoA hydrolase